MPVIYFLFSGTLFDICGWVSLEPRILTPKSQRQRWIEMQRQERSRKAPNDRVLRTRLSTLKTALLSDALGKTGGLDHDMKCFSAKCQMAGPAATLRVHPADILMIGRAISECPKGS